MANIIQVKRGTNANRTGFTPAAGEFIYTTDTNQLFIGDGSTLAQNLLEVGADLAFEGDSGSGSITSAESLDIAGGIGIVTTASGNALTVDFDIDGLTTSGGLDDTDEIVVDDVTNGVRKATLATLKSYINAAAGTFSSFTITGDTGTEQVDDAETVDFAGGTGITTAVTDSGGDASPYTVTINHDAHTGDVTGSTALTIADEAVTLAKMQHIATDTFLGRDTASTGDVEQLSVATVQTMLSISGTNTGDEVQATTTVQGIAETATAGETETGTSTTHMVTPDSLAGVTSLAAMAWFRDDDTLGGGSSSDTKVPSEQSVKAYVDAAVASTMTYQGGYDASANPATSPAVGDMYTVTTSGSGTTNFWGTTLEVGDVIIAETTDGTVAANWTVVQTDIDPSVYALGTDSITAGTGLSYSVGDGGFDTSSTIDLDINSLTNEAAVDGATDYVACYSDSNKKVLINDLLDGGTF